MTGVHERSSRSNFYPEQIDMRWPTRIGIGAGALLAVAPLAGAIVARRAGRDPGPGPNGLKFPVNEALYPFAHHFVSLPNGARIHYLDEGPSQATETLVFLHGNPTWSFLYRNIVKELRGEYRCIALDYPGFGLSEAPPGYDFLPRTHSQSVEQLFDALKLSNVALMVQDWGGPIGLGMAGRRPELVKSLVIGNTWAWPKDEDPRSRKFSSLMGGPIGRFFGLNFNAIPYVFFAIGARDTLPNEAMEMYLRPFRRADRREPTVIFPREIIASTAYLAEVQAGLARIADRPALIVWGAEDFAFRPPDRERFERRFPRHRTVVLETAKHYIQEDEPGRIAAEIRGFLRSPPM
jgi:haloalkane dehalogenase